MKRILRIGEEMEPGVESPKRDINLKEIRFDREEPTGFYLDHLDYPSFIMSFPFNLSNESPNNVLMDRYENQEINYDKAYRQWLDLYIMVASHSLVYVMPSAPELQDQTYTANAGIVMPKSLVSGTAILSNYRSKPRAGEEEVARKFLEMLGFNVLQPKSFFEGEADLKYVRDNIFVGGYGIRTDIESFYFISEQCGAHIIPVKMTDDKLYHFDCMFFPLDRENAMVVTDVMSKEELKSIEKVVNVIPVKKEFGYEGITNCVRVGSLILCASDVDELSSDDERYLIEKEKVSYFEHVVSKLSLEPVIINLSEFDKSGSALSCFIMHLNYKDYE